MNAFLTGSRMYGNHKPDSDVDLVILVDEETKEMLTSLSDLGKLPCMFGRLNLILCTTQVQFSAWNLAMEKCKEQKGISKDEAIEIHDNIRSLVSSIYEESWS